jgi:hypothetical protein
MKLSAPRGPNVDSRFAVAGYELGPTVPVQSVTAMRCSGACDLQHVRCSRSREPHLQEGRLPAIHRDAVMSTVTVQIEC